MSPRGGTAMRRPLAAGLGLVGMAGLLCLSGAAAAFPRGDATAVRDQTGCINNCAVSHGALLLPFGAYTVSAQLGAYNDDWNRSAAGVQLRPGVGAVPFMPGGSTLALSVFAARTLEHAFLTEYGIAGGIRVLPTPYYDSEASATFRDDITFVDVSQPLGAPITVTLGYYLHSDVCGGSGGPCELLPPPGLGNANDPRALPSSSTIITSRVDLPGGTDDVHSLRVETTASSWAGGGTSYGVNQTIGNTLSHSFTVANGSTVPYTLGVAASVSFYGTDYDDLAEAYGYFTGWRRLDYADTLKIGEISAVDAQGQPLTGVQMINSYGWAMLAEPLLAVPEPGQGALLALGIGFFWVTGRLRRAVQLRADKQCVGART